MADRRLILRALLQPQDANPIDANVIHYAMKRVLPLISSIPRYLHRYYKMHFFCAYHEENGSLVPRLGPGRGLDKSLMTGDTSQVGLVTLAVARVRVE